MYAEHAYLYSRQSPLKYQVVAMSNENQRFKEMVENSQDFFWEFDQDANFTYVSPRIKDLLGYEPEELIGLNAFDLMGDAEAERVRKHFDPIAKKHQPFNHLENVNRHKDGHTVVIESSGTPIFDAAGEFLGYRGIDRDITLRKRVEEDLRDSKAKIQNILDTSSEWIWEIDLSGRHSYSNNRLLELLGYYPQEVIGKDCLAFLHEDDLEEVEKSFPRLIAQKRGWNGWVLRWRHRDGSYRYLESNAAPVFDKAGVLIGYSGADRDITERKRGELALLVATQSAESANRAKSQFLANMSHEIRTPMAAIVGFAELLQMTELTAEQKQFLAAIDRSSDTLMVLINDVLDLSKVESGELTFNQENFSLSSVIDNLVEMQNLKMTNKDLSLNINIDANVPDLLVGDPLRVQQVLTNLLSNAIKFTEKGAVGINVSMAELNESRVLLDITVSDTGVGILPEFQEKIFESFVQAPVDGSCKNGGTGLGLTISQSVARLMGGHIRVESEPGVGSTFHFVVPLQKQDGAGLKLQPEEKEPPSRSIPALTILLVEDSPVNVQLFKIMLKNMGHVVTVAKNGKKALDALTVNSFDLMLTDIQMPVMNGVELLQTLRQCEQFKKENLKVIALTAYALIGEKEKYLAMGFDGYLSKPFKADALLAEMLRVLDLEQVSI
jgi:PAS domain S-box-containing protein